MWVGGVARFTPRKFPRRARQLSTSSLVSPIFLQIMVFLATSTLSRHLVCGITIGEDWLCFRCSPDTLQEARTRHGFVRISAPQILTDCSLCTLQTFCLNISVVVKNSRILGVGRGVQEIGFQESPHSAPLSGTLHLVGSLARCSTGWIQHCVVVLCNIPTKIHQIFTPRPNQFPDVLLFPVLAQ